MSSESPSADYYEFGPFALDVAKGCLYYSGEFVSLTPKAYEILRVLVEEAGHVVTKEQLLERVWPDAHVEEGSISNQVFALRKILNPHFEGDGPIVTVPRRGYRFIEPVRLRSAHGEVAIQSPPVLPAAPASPAFEIPPTKPAEEPAAHVYRYRRLVWAGAAMLSMGAVLLALSSRRAPPARASLAPRPCIAGLPLRNLSQDSQVDWVATALTETLATDLAAGGRVRMVSGERVSQTPQGSVRGPLSREQLSDIGRRLGCNLVVSGAYLSVGGKIRIDLRLDDTHSGETLSSVTETDEQVKLVDLVSRAGNQLHAALRIPLVTPAQSEAVRASVSPNSDATRLYFEGLGALRLRDGPRARQLLSAAVAADPDYALAHAALSNAFRLLGYDSKGAEEARLALERGRSLLREDRLNIEAQYSESTGSWDKAVESYQTLWRFFSDNIEYGLKLGNAQHFSGKAKETLETIAEMRKLPAPDGNDPRIDLLESTSAQASGDLTRAFQAATRAADTATAASSDLLLARARIKQGVDCYRTRPLDARKYFAEAREMFDKLGDRGGVADALRWDASVLIDRRELDAAEAALTTALTLSRSLDYVRLTAQILMLEGQASRERGKLENAEAELSEALALARESGVKADVAYVLNSLGIILKARGDYVGARARYEEAARILQEINRPSDMAISLNNIGNIDLLQGHIRDARRVLEESIAIKRRTGQKVSLVATLQNLGQMLEMRSDFKGADQALAEECQIAESLDMKLALLGCQARLAELRLAQGRTAEATALASQVVAKDNWKSMQPVDVARVAKIQMAGGDWKASRATVAAAEKILAARSHSPEEAVAVSIVAARLAAATGSKSEAERRLKDGAAEAARYGLKPYEIEARLALLDLAGRNAKPAERVALAAEADKWECRLLAERVRAQNR